MSNYYDRSAPKYNYDPYAQQDTRVVMQPESIETKSRWNWCSHGWSMFALFCCPWCVFSCMFAMCGVVCAMSSYTDHKAGDYERARYKKSCSIGWTIVSIILGAGALATGIYFLIMYAALFLAFFSNLLAQIA